MNDNDLSPETSAAALAFLLRFSRFEYALKTGGYLKSSDAGKKAEPNWDMFVKRNRNRYQASPRALALLALQPRQQLVVANARLVWQPLQFAETEFELQKATLLLRLVRNNLFHGGRHDSPWMDQAWTVQVLETGSQVLDELAAFAKLVDAYEGPR